jgi:hypothetical protein
VTVPDVVLEIERDLIRNLDDADLQALLTQARRAVLMIEHDWVVDIFEARIELCKQELNWRIEAQKRGGPSVDKRDFSSRLAAVKLHKTIADVVMASGVELRQSGRAYKGLCPFNEEKTPSFACWQESGLFKCFGCGAHGDMVDYVTEFKGVDKKMALEILEGRSA